MSREIKCRGLRKDTNKWVYGYYCRIGKRHFIIPGNTKITAFWGDIDIGRTLLEITGFIKVIPESVGWWTGLLDKNDIEIYDGDIARYGTFAINDVKKFGDRPWENVPESVDDSDITTTLKVFVIEYDFEKLYALEGMITANPDVEGIEIIGNIHQNPELLKSK